MAVRHRVTKSSVKTPPPPSAKLKSIGVMYHGYRLRFLFTISRTRYSAEVSRILPSTFPERVYSKNMESYTFERTYGGGVGQTLCRKQFPLTSPQSPTPSPTTVVLPMIACARHFVLLFPTDHPPPTNHQIVIRFLVPITYAINPYT